MEKTWAVNARPDENEIKALSEAIPCSPLVATLLLQRGVTTAGEANAFFFPTLDMLHDPFLMKDMDKAVDRIDRAIANGEKVMLYGDYDVDGTTSVALLYKHFKGKFANPSYYIPKRYTEGSGLSTIAIDKAVKEHVSLIIVADCGVKSIEQVAYAKEKNVDVIICDHHTTGDTLPEAVAVLNPRRNDCGYPYKWLSGCGVSFKLAQAYDRRHGIPGEKLHELLDLVCVSIASDIVPVTGENRILAHFGLECLNSNPSLGLRTIIESAGVKELSITNIVARVGPKINAAGRVESGDKSVELLIAEEVRVARRVAASLDTFNDRRKKLDHDVTAEAVEALNASAASRGKATVLYNPGWHGGVIGIVALRLLEHYYRPTMILTDSDDLVIGSARSVEGYDLYEAVSRCSEYLENYGGHKYAVGLTLKRENLDAFRSAFQRVVAETIPAELTRPQISIDARANLEEITPELYNMLQLFAPFGPDNTAPVFLSEGVSNFGSRQVGRHKEHLQLVVVDDARVHSCDESRARVYTDRGGIAFGMGHLFTRVNNGEVFDICYTLQKNDVSRKENDIQMLVRDIRFKEDQ
ncbi:MAG: single-stranded-DNA-specific exonuclease RecJ [Odoribacteraceae bacterium]|jgi:single-stranded-DNA-specific exonuclease|nr:single-stranded-DNA-specific exonuclease RecJ [Odoribacteraceae bacterium]